MLAAALAAVATVNAAGAATGSNAAAATSLTPNGVSFDGDFRSGLTPWTSTGGGPQCANYGTPSTAPRMRGAVHVDSTTTVGGLQAARFDLPASQLPDWPLQACELLHPTSLGLDTDSYYGLMFYVPQGWTDGTSGPSGFWGIAVAQFHFQNVWGSPIEYELHDDHVTLSLQTGPCRTHLTASPGCQYHTNADNPSGNPGTLPAEYAVPRGMQQGVWHELVMHVHWASDSTGQVQVWHRVKGDPSWTQTVDVSGIPTVQWDETQACCSTTAAVDKIGAYRGPASAPVSVWETDELVGSTFNGVASALGQPAAVAPATTAPASSKSEKATQARQRKARARRASIARKKARRHAAACAAQRKQARHHSGTRRSHRRHHRVMHCTAVPVRT